MEPAIRPGADWKPQTPDGFTDVTLRDRRRHRQDHDLPARGAQRVPAPHAVRAARRVRDRPRRPRGRRHHLHRRRPRRVLLGRRPARARRRRLPRRQGHRPPERARSAGADPPACRSRWSRWSRATRSAAGTCCTSCATSRSRPTTRASARPVRGSVRSTAVTARACSRASSARRRRARSGTCASSTTRRPRSTWASSTRSCRSPTSRSRPSRGRARCSQHSPLALRMLKASMNAADDGLAGIQQLAGDATLLYYMTEEAQEGKNAYLEKRTPDFDQYPEAPVTTRSHDARRRGSVVPGRARPKTLGAAISPVLVGTAAGIARRPDRTGGARGRCARRRARVAGRRQLRQRLLRRRPRHRRGAARAGAAHRDRSRDAERGAQRGGHRRSRSPRSSARCCRSS